MNGWLQTLERCLSVPTIKYQSSIYRAAESARSDISRQDREWDNISQQQNAAKNYRDNRKAHRGRWVGGGFGVGGAVKGAITAGAMNAASGMAHSAVNAMGNFVTASLADQQRKNVVNSLDHVPNIMYGSLKKNLKELFNDIQDDTDNLLPELDYFNETKTQSIIAIADVSKRKEQAIKILKKAPSSPGTYLIIMKLYGEELNEDALQEFADNFGVNVKEVCLKYLEDIIYGTDFSIDEAKRIGEIFDILFKEHSESEEYEEMLYSYMLQTFRTILNSGDQEWLLEFCENVYQFDAVIPERGLLRRFRECSIDPLILKVQKQLNAKDKSEQVRSNLSFLRFTGKYILPDILELADALLNQYARLCAEEILEKSEFSAISTVVDKQKEVKDIDKYLITSGAERQFVESLHSYIKAEAENLSLDGVKELKKYVNRLSEELGYDFSEIMAYVEERIHELEVESRTVLGVLYATKEEADIERKKVANGIKFETEEEAENERKKYEREKNLEYEELMYIDAVEKKYASMTKRIVELRKREYSNVTAQSKVAEYEEKAKQQYEEYLQLKSSGQLQKEKFQSVFWFILGMIACLAGFLLWKIVPFVGKVIIVFVILYLFGTMLGHKEAVNEIREKLQSYKELEGVIKKDEKK